MARTYRLLAGALVLLAAVSPACASGGESESPVTSAAVVTGPAQVTGTVVQLGAEKAATDPIPPPFAINVVNRGTGGAEITGATVNKKTTQINWNGGQPLPVTGNGPGLDLITTGVFINPTAVVWALDGGPRDFLPGTYTLGSAVAVGAGGLATPVDKVTFTAGENTALTTRGRANIRLPAALTRIEGREGSLVLIGEMTLSRAGVKDRKVSKITFGPGTYEVTLTPLAGKGYTVVARLEGKIVA